MFLALAGRFFHHSVLICALLVGCEQASDKFESTAAPADIDLDVSRFENKGLCRHVVDGDSLYVQGQKTQIRLWGVDAPERDEPGYQRAKNALSSMAKNKHIRCATKDIDKYDRIVARCYLDNGKEINRQLLDSGVAKEYCRFTKNHYGHCSY